MSFRRVFQIVTLVFVLAFTFSATAEAGGNIGLECDPQGSGGGYC